MGSQRVHTLRPGLSLALAACLLSGSTPGLAKHGIRVRAAKTAASAPAAEIDTSDVPPASVTFSASDISPGDAARVALSRLVAEPGAVLKAYAPVRLDRPAPASATLDARPVAASPASVGLRGSALPGASPRQTPASPGDRAMAAPLAIPSAGAPSGHAAAVPVQGDFGRAADPAPRPGEGSHDRPEPAPVVDVGSPGSTLSAPIVPDASEPTILDATTLEREAEAFVGPDTSATGDPLAAHEQRRRKEREAILAVYAQRGFAPLWVEYGRFNASGRSILSRIDHAAEDGLSVRGASVSVPHDGDPKALAAAELSLTEAAIAYGRQASGGRLDPARLSELIAAKPDVPDASRIIAALVAAPDAGEALRAFNPSHKGYAQLRAKLAELRQSTELSGRDPIPYGPALKAGMRDPRVPLVRTRFGLDIHGDRVAQDELVYDTRVAAAVAEFQRAHGLPASGVLTARTVAVLSGGNPGRLENEIIANMERWRWLPRDLGENRVEVNIPDFTLNVMHGEAVVHHARVVVGKPDHPTPVFSQDMTFIIVNPYWNVPLSIVKKEMLPKLAADPDYFANHGYEVVERNGVTYVRQPPGDSNALGRIKFMFPNRFSVYLHDTNARALFGSGERALSHGCVRVDQPFKLAEVVLGRENGWTEARVKRMVGGNERTITLPHATPLHIEYFTAFVDDTGALRLRDDVYGYSAKVKAALGLES